MPQSTEQSVIGGRETFGEPKKLGQQLKYADRRGFAVALIVGQEEYQRQECQVKWLESGKTQTVSLANNAVELTAELHRLLQGKC